jgi:hypothetical protein
MDGREQRMSAQRPSTCMKPSVSVCMKATSASSSASDRPRRPIRFVFILAVDSGAGQQVVPSPESFGGQRPSSITLDIDDTFDAVHGQQQLSLFNAQYDERCFLPIHIYEGTTGKPVALREGKTPTGKEVRTVLKHVIKRIRSHWPKVAILVRGDSHYGRDEAMEWCENHNVDYVFGFAGNDVLHALTREAADAICVQRALFGRGQMSRLQGFSLRRKDLGPGAAFCGPHRGDAQGSGCPLCRHLAQGRRQASL